MPQMFASELESIQRKRNFTNFPRKIPTSTINFLVYGFAISDNYV